MDGAATPWISALRSSHDRLATLVTPLGPDQVTRPSMASDWTVAQVLSHLGSQAEIFGAILVAVLEGGELPGRDSFPPIWDAWNSRSPADQVADGVAANGALVERLESLPEAQLAALWFPMFGMDLDAVGFLRMRLSEHAVHTWDVAAALEPGATVAPDAVDLLFDGLPDLVRRAGKGRDEPVRVRVVTSDPTRELVLVVAEEVHLDPWDSGSADGELRLPAEAFLRLVYGRLLEAPAAVVEYDATALTLDDLRAVFPGF